MLHNFNINGSYYYLHYLYNPHKMWAIHKLINKISKSEIVMNGLLKENNIIEVQYELIVEQNLIELNKYIEKYFKLLAFK